MEPDTLSKFTTLDENQINILFINIYICYISINAVKTEILSTDLANLKCGSLSRGCWLTTSMGLLLMWNRQTEQQRARDFENHS